MTKTRITKRLVAIATTMLMLALMVMPASAAADGKITVHKYAGDSLAGALPNFTGEQVAVPAGFTPLEDAGFTVYHLPDALVTNVINAATGGVTFISHTVNASALPPSVTWTLSDNTTHTVTAVPVAWGAEAHTDATGEVVFHGGDPAGAIPDGWYVLVETDAPAGHIAATPSLIQMPMTLSEASGGGNNYDIHVYPKNITSSGIANKDMDGVLKPVTTGDEMNFDLKSLFSSSSVSTASDLRASAVPTTSPADYGTAIIKEHFNLYFEQVGTDANISVQWLDAAGNLDGTVLTQDTHYTITRTPADATNGEIITVQLTREGIDAAIAANAPGFGFRLRAKYIGAPSAAVGGSAPVTNTMASIMSAPLVVPQPPVIDVTHVPTISIVGTKVDESGDPLAGATFKVSRVAVNPQAADFVKDANGDDLEVTTDGTGVFSFSNLPDYSNATGATYYLIETVTPAGYNGGTVVAVIWANQTDHFAAVPGDSDGDGNWAENINLVKTVTIKNTLIGETNPNSPGFSLPLTGGAGTILFTAIGILVMLGAAGAYVHGKKRSIEK